MKIISFFCSSRTRRFFEDIVGDERGAFAILFALMLPLLVGGLGLGIEAANWYSSKRTLQSAADAAAIAAVYEVRGIPGTISSSLDLLPRATTEAERNGLNTAGGDTITLNYYDEISPSSYTTDYSTDDGAVEVILSKSVPLYFARWFMTGSAVNVGSQSVATLQQSSEACFLALDSSSNGTMSFSGGSNVTLEGCSIASNSSSSSALKLSGGSSVTTECASSVGDNSIGSSSTLSTSCSSVATGVRAVSDPYESVDEPTSDVCLQSNNYNPPDGVLPAGTYCKGLNLDGNITLEDDSVYIIDRGTLSIGSGAVVTGNNVTIFLTSSTGSQYAGLSINSGASVTLTAPNSGSYAGILFYQDDDAPTSGNNNMINGGAMVDLTGALYFPNGDITFTGGAMMPSGASCMQLVAQNISITGDAYINTSCASSYGMKTISVKNKVGLVE